MAATRTELRTRTRIGSDAVLLALGVNVWVSLILVPALFTGALQRRSSAMFLAALPLVPLAIGAARRSPSWLLLVYPATLLGPILADFKILAAGVQGPVTFAIVAAGLVAYLFGAAFLTGLRDSPPPERMRRLPSAGPERPARWRRRSRIYAALTILSMAFPLTLIWAINFSKANQAFLKGMYPGRAGSLTLLLNLGALALWLALFASVFLAPLHKHRTGDRELAGAIESLRRRARRGAPRAVFYLAVLSALVFMGVLLHLRYR